MYSTLLFLVHFCRQTSTNWQVSTWHNDLSFSNYHLTTGYIKSHDTMSVAYSWKSSGNVTAVRLSCLPLQASMNAFHVPGSPYITLNATGLTFNITSGYPFVSLDGLPVSQGLKVSGTEFVIETKAQKWVLYSLTSMHSLFPVSSRS